MPKISDTSSKHVLKDDPIRTVIAVNVSPPSSSEQQFDFTHAPRPPSISNSSTGGGVTAPGGPKSLIDRTLSHRSSVVNFVKSGNNQGKKLGHRRVRDDGEVTYKKFQTTQLMGSIQLGLHYVLSNETDVPDRDILFPVRQDF